MPLQVGEEPPLVVKASISLEKPPSTSKDEEEKREANEQWSARIVAELFRDFQNTDLEDSSALSISSDNVDEGEKEKDKQRAEKNKRTNARIVDDIFNDQKTKKENRKESRSRKDEKQPNVVFDSEDIPSSSNYSYSIGSRQEEKVRKEEADSSSQAHSDLNEADKIVNDLLNDVKLSKKPFTIEDIVEDIEKTKRLNKKKKKHKEKKSKKKHKHRSRSRSRSSNERDRKRSKRCRSRTGSSSKSRDNTATSKTRSERSRSSRSHSRERDWKNRDQGDRVEGKGKDEVFKKAEKKSRQRRSSKEDQLESDDDLPLGADFTVVAKSKSAEKIHNLPLRKGALDDGSAFPLSKDTAVIPDDKEGLREEIPLLPRKIALKSVGKEKEGDNTRGGKASVVIEEDMQELTEKTTASSSRNSLKKEKKKYHKSKERDDSRSSNSSKRKEKKEKNKERKRKYSSSSYSSSNDSRTSHNTWNGDSKPIVTASQPKRVLTDRWCAVITNMVKPRRTPSPARSSRRDKSPYSRRRESRSRSREDTGKMYSDREKEYERRGRTRNNSGPRRSRDRSNDRRSASIERRKRRRSTSWDRRRRNDIDKEYLLKVAKKNARMMGLSDKSTVDDFVTYCQKIQKRQDKEKRRDRGEMVSSDSDGSLEDHPIKHPYAIPKAEPIKINIVTAGTGQKALPSSEIVDEAELRVVFPVSSGLVHKENAEWTPVIKDKNQLVPVSCQNSQKKKVAMTSKEAQQALESGLIKELPMPAPPLLCLLPPPPPPPKFLPEPQSMEPIELPPVLYVPPQEQLIIKEPDFYKDKLPKDLPAVLAQRAKAMKRLEIDPNDYQARKELRESDEQMKAWAALKNLAGKFSGTTGLQVLSPEELQPHDPRYNSWIKKDMFKNAPAKIEGVGLRLMQKMGWKPGRGLGRTNEGSIEPLTLDVKSDRRGLLSEEDLPTASRMKSYIGRGMETDAAGKHPVSLVMEYCQKKHWKPPIFTCIESGAPNNREYLWKAVVNGIEYQPVMASRVKKDGKSAACMVVLQSLGLIPNDITQPVRIQ